MIIHPEVIVTPDCPTVRIREAREVVDLDVEIPRIIHYQGWDIGTYFHVQFISHDRDVLLSVGRFVVTEVKEQLHVSDANPYQPTTKTVFGRKYEQLGDWWFSEAGKVEKKKEDPRPEATKFEPEIKWNPGVKKHQVILNGVVIFESEDKEAAVRVKEGELSPDAA